MLLGFQFGISKQTIYETLIKTNHKEKFSQINGNYVSLGLVNGRKSQITVTKRLLDHAWHSVQHTCPPIKIHDIYAVAALQILNGFPKKVTYTNEAHMHTV